MSIKRHGQTNMIKQRTFGDAQDWGDNRRVPCGRNCLPCCKWQGDKSLLQRAGEQLFGASTAPFFDAVDLWKIDAINWVMANGFTINDAYTSCFKLADGVVHLAMDVRGTIGR